MIKAAFFIVSYPVLSEMRVFIFVPLLFFYTSVVAQYTVNGSASANNCRCYQLTPDANTQSGSVWNNNKIDLSLSFDYNFDVYLGCTDANGADGIAFVLQPISTSVGGSGGGLGFEGITPSAGVTIDTWQNTDVSDPAYDHISIQLNGDINHSSTAANIAGPVTALAGSDNIEDCRWHTLRIVWDAVTKTLTAFVDGDQRLTVTKDLVADVFAGNPQVYWGFTGSTGGARNLQQFCTALIPLYKSLDGQNRCVNSPIRFSDSSISFAPITKMYWDFGDGSPVDSVNRSPVHIYTTPGNYNIIQTALGADGCRATNTSSLLIGSKPVVDFSYTDSCVTNQIIFTDASTVSFGTISNWYWDFDNGTTASGAASATTQYANGGDKNIKLLVTTAEGCVSDTFTKPIHIYQRPVLDFTFNDSVCLGNVMNFNGIVVNSPDPVQAFAWNFGDNIPRPSQNTSFVYQTPGPHPVLFTATASGAGCLGLIEKTVFVRSKPIAALKNDFVCQSVNSVLLDSSYTIDGKAITSWWWDTGNGISTLQNPTVTFNTVDTISIKLVVQSGACISDTLIKPLIVAAKPLVDFSINGRTCEGQVLQFADSSKVQNGTVAQWTWLFQGSQFSNEQNPTRSFAKGLQSVSLAVTSNKGCRSDTVPKSFTIIEKPLFTINFNEACTGGVVNFTATDLSGTIQKWAWDFGDGSSSFAKDSQNIYHTPGTYKVTLTAEAGTGCINTDSSFITIYSTDANITADTIIAAANEPIQLSATGGISYEWLPADGLNNAFIASPVAINTENQQYIVRAYTPVGCDSYDTVLVRIFDGPQIYVPTAFNPKSTVGNNIFRAIPVGIIRFKYLTVYNRLGQVVFSTSNPQQGWDGTFKGRPQDTGTYVWITAGTTFRGTEIIRKGTVVLVR